MVEWSCTDDIRATKKNHDGHHIVISAGFFHPFFIKDELSRAIAYFGYRLLEEKLIKINLWSWIHSHSDFDI